MSKNTYSNGDKEVSIERHGADVCGFEVPGTGDWVVKGGGESARHFDTREEAKEEAARRLMDDDD